MIVRPSTHRSLSSPVEAQAKFLLSDALQDAEYTGPELDFTDVASVAERHLQTFVGELTDDKYVSIDPAVFARQDAQGTLHGVVLEWQAYDGERTLCVQAVYDCASKAFIAMQRSLGDRDQLDLL